MLDIELVHEPGAKSFFELDKLLLIAVHFLGDNDDLRTMDRPSAIRFFKTVDAILQFYGFEYQENSLLSRALITKKIDCDGYSAIYLAIGELLKVPIAMVRAPSHTFVRVRLKDNKYVNWETTVAESKSDAYYIAKHHIAERTQGRSALKSLDVKSDRNRILSGTFVNCGVEWMRKLKLDKALLYFDEAIERDPEYDAPFYNKGLVYFHMGDFPRAVMWCEKAVSENPNHLLSRPA
jgi:tetratricopeptide (TPR) repeat protein